jgi:hypothetical protein
MAVWIKSERYVVSLGNIACQSYQVRPCYIYGPSVRTSVGKTSITQVNAYVSDQVVGGAVEVVRNAGYRCSGGVLTKSYPAKFAVLNM